MGATIGAGPAQRKAVESLAHGIVRKLLHQPVTALREAAKGDDAYAATALAEAGETLFGVEETETAEASADDPALAAAANPAKSV